MKRMWLLAISIVFLMLADAVSVIAEEGDFTKVKAPMHRSMSADKSLVDNNIDSGVDGLFGAASVTASANKTNLIKNPDFESGDTEWAYISSEGFQLITNEPGYGNNGSDWYTYMGDYDGLNESVFQQVTIPADATAATLNFYYYIETDETSTSKAKDTIKVELIDFTTASSLVTLVSLSNLNATTDWVMSQTFNLLAYKGKTVWLKFSSKTDSLLPTAFLIDDVTLGVTGSGSDPVPPAVTSIQPKNGATNVIVDGAIKATFSEAMTASTITTDTFSLNKGVTGTVSYDPATFIATFTPSAPLAPNTTYTATLTTGVKDSTGTSLAANKTWSFKTATVATHFTISAPTVTVPGVAFSFTVTALDEFDTTMTAYNGTIHFTSSDAGAALPADATLVDGVGKFQATLNSLGSWTLTATATATASISGTSGGISNLIVVAINKGASLTKSNSVPLNLNYPGAVSAKFSSDRVKWTAWETFKATRTFTLASGDGIKTVYVRFKDRSAKVSPVFSDTIILDTTKPTAGRCSVAAGDDNALALTWTAASDANGIKSYKLYYSDTGSPQCSGTPLATVAGGQALAYLHNGLSAAKTHYYRVCALDNANNLSLGATAGGKPVDTIAPTNPRVSINGGASFTSKTTVNLGLSATDASGLAGVCIGNTPTCTAWQPYASTKTSSLTAGQGVKTVYVRYKDTVGNVSEQGSSTIILDTTPPQDAKITINNGDPKTKNLKVTLQLDATDNNSVMSMQFSNNGSTWSGWQAFTPTRKWSLIKGADGSRKVFARFKDAAGNVSVAVKDTIGLDTVPPVLSIDTAPFTTSMNGIMITGTKEANSTVRISLNGISLDDSRITQTLAGTTWQARVESFTEKSNIVSVTATDSALNETVKTLSVTYKPFTSADLAGDWSFVSSGFEPSGMTSWTGYGTMRFDAAELFSSDFSNDAPFSGSYSDGSSGGELGGNLTFDGDGTLLGNTLFQGETLNVVDGRMSDNRSIFTLLVGNEMVTAVKKGSGFQQTQLAGKWYVYGVSTSPDYYSSAEWGTLVFDSTGKITSGSFTHVLKGQNVTTIKYTLTGNGKLAADGGVGGTMKILCNSNSTKAPYSGQMSVQKNVAIVRSSAKIGTTDLRNKMILIKDGGTFTLSDLEGRWRFEGIYNSMDDGEVYYGYIDIASGKVVAGEINGESLVDGTGFSISSAGVITVTGNLQTGSGKKYGITTGKLDSKKKIMVLRSKVSVMIGYSNR